MPQSAPPRQTKCQQRVCRAILALLQATEMKVWLFLLKACLTHLTYFDMFKYRNVLKDINVEY